MLSSLVLNHVSFDLPNGRTLFQDLSFSLSQKRTALVGPNGIGKTSLARILAGEVSPTSGSLQRDGHVTLFSQKETPPSVSVNTYLLKRSSWHSLVDRLLEGINGETLCPHLSGGQWMRVRLATLPWQGFLILDEPTNDLDQQNKAILRDLFQIHKDGILLISHDREFLQLCDEILELSNRGLEKYGVPWTTYETLKQQEREGLHANLSRAKQERDKAKAERTQQLERQKKRNRKGAANAEKGGLPKILAGGRKRRAQATTGAIDAATLANANNKVQAAYDAFASIKLDPVMYADLAGQPIPNQKLVAEASGFNVNFSGWLYAEDLTFSWRGNIRIALHGANGSGKTTLIKAIMGASFPTKGDLRIGNLRTLYLDQRCSILDDEKSVLENVQAHSHLDEGEIRNGLAKILFFGDSVFQKAHSLSGGERLRAALACGLLADEKLELIIFDESTNNLDLDNIQFLEKLISHFKGAVLVVSHDDVILKNCGIDETFVLKTEKRQRP